MPIEIPEGVWLEVSPDHENPRLEYDNHRFRRSKGFFDDQPYFSKYYSSDKPWKGKPGETHWDSLVTHVLVGEKLVPFEEGTIAKWNGNGWDMPMEEL